MNSPQGIHNYFEPIFSKIDLENVLTGTFRLDSQYYALFENKLLKLDSETFISLEECCKEIYEVPPFKHIYVKSGIPFYTSSSLFENELIPSHFLTPDMPNIDTYRIKKEQILMARSGNVESGILGQILLVGEILNNSTTSDHVLRFTPYNSKINSGYLTAFLMSDFCKGQLLKNAAGAVIPAIRPDSLKNLQIPLVDDELQIEIGNKIISAVEGREKAIKILNKARDLVLQYNNLPPLSEELIETLDPEKETEIRLTNLSEFTDDYRLDAHFYNPLAKKAIENIKGDHRCLSEVTTSVFMCERFTRNYVEKGFGLPFLSGKNTIQIRPDVKYISITETNSIDNLKLKKGWITITRSGTLGRVCYIWNNYEDFTATEDLIRVIPSSEIDGAYLYAFLSSEYGYNQILRYKHGAVIDHLAPEDMNGIIVPTCNQQEEIADLVRQAYDLRAEAIKLEDEAQEILTKALTKNN